MFTFYVEQYGTSCNSGQILTCHNQILFQNKHNVLTHFLQRNNVTTYGNSNANYKTMLNISRDEII